MKYFNNYLEFSKLYRAEIKNTKSFLLIIVNIWLILIFWKILLISDASIINNNVTLTKATLLLQPILSILGLDVLSPNMLKMMVLTFIVMVTNLSILYFNQMASIIVLTIFARYGHKSYTNYLKNQENLSYLGFETKKEALKQAEPSRIIIENTPVVADSVNHTHWGVWLAMGLAVVVCFGLLVYSHNNLVDNIANVNNGVDRVNTNLGSSVQHINEKIIRTNQQIDINSTHSNKMLNLMDNKINLIDAKVVNLETTVQKVNENLVKVNELGNQNVWKLAEQSITISTEAKTALAEIADASTTSEAATIGFAKVVELIKNFNGRLDITEARLDSITGANTPRSRMGNIVLNTNPLNNIRKTNE